MIESMTGYGEAAAEDAAVRVTVSARSVNHRFLDLAIRLPESLRSQEPTLAKLVRHSVGRGRVDLRVDMERVGDLPVRVRLRTEVVRAYLEALAVAREEELVSDHPSVGDLLRLPEVLDVRTEDGGTVAGSVDVVHATARRAIAALVEARRAEGERIGAVLRSLLEELQDRVARLEASREAIKATLQTRLSERLNELVGERGIDPDRLAQEVALLVDRSDVAEELARLRSHLVAALELLGRPEPVGKKLDFLAQEILRELNTVNSKARDTSVAQQVVDAKVLCEQVREQLQNVQ